ncbi:ABC transporter ATP-binding protein [Microbacterium sp. NPDC058389]|uniref:ABC transporter ATP-binding protein n=1 Tax=Microbacterium sp. NPDC058389 TaxID=3346475 RepID=UPI00364DC775
MPRPDVSPATPAAAADVLRIDALEVGYVVADGVAPAVRGVDLTVRSGELVALAGESGCGKSTIAQSVLRILRPPGVITGGRILLEGEDVLAMSPARLRRVRWARAAIVMQNSLTALDPVHRVGDQIDEVVRAHRRDRGGGRHRTTGELLEMVGIDARRGRDYPHELSGGMRQRAAIAMALALSPSLIVMDEPTTALDVVVQREILAMVTALQHELGFGVLLISHDLPLLTRYADRIAVMKDGLVVEETTPAELAVTGGLDSYTRRLVASVPRPGTWEAA